MVPSDEVVLFVSRGLDGKGFAREVPGGLELPPLPAPLDGHMR